jgi:hypothetical protein
MFKALFSFNLDSQAVSFFLKAAEYQKGYLDKIQLEQNHSKDDAQKDNSELQSKLLGEINTFYTSYWNLYIKNNHTVTQSIFLDAVILNSKKYSKSGITYKHGYIIKYFLSQDSCAQQLLNHAKSLQKNFNYFLIFQNFNDLSANRKLMENGFYFSYYYDFRGRTNSSSPISVYNHAVFRDLYYFGHYSSEEVSTATSYTSRTTRTIEKYTYIYKNFLVLNNISLKFSQAIF